MGKQQQRRLNTVQSLLFSYQKIGGTFEYGKISKVKKTNLFSEKILRVLE